MRDSFLWRARRGFAMRFPRLAGLTLILIALTSGCAAFEANRPPSVSQVDATEALLAQSGFRTLNANEPDELATAHGLPAYEIHGYQGPSGAVFWYYDPRGCQCVWTGDAAAFERYRWLMQQKHDIAEYSAETSSDSVTSLNALNPYWFPLPIYFYPIGFVGLPGDISHRGGHGHRGGKGGGTSGSHGGGSGGSGGHGGKGGGGHGAGGGHGGGGATAGGHGGGAGGWGGDHGGGWGGGHGGGWGGGHGGGHGR